MSFQASACAGAFGATVVTMVPPAASTAARAVAEAPDTVMVTARVSAPTPNRRTPCLSLAAMPAPINSASVIGCEPSILPAAIAASRVPRFSGAYSLRKWLKNPRYGKRR